MNMSRLALSISLFLSFTSISIECITANIVPETSISIENVTYDYELSSNSNGIIDCWGQLKFEVNLPKETKYVLYYRTAPYFEYKNHIFFGLCTPYMNITDNPLIVSDNNIRWGRHFKIRVRLNDGSWIESQTENTNSFIREDDLKALNQISYLEESTIEPVSLFIDNGQLHVIPLGDINLTVADFNGHLLFSTVISQPTSISLEKSTTSHIIVKYAFNGSIIIKKFRIK